MVVVLAASSSNCRLRRTVPDATVTGALAPAGDGMVGAHAGPTEGLSKKSGALDHEPDLGVASGRERPYTEHIFGPLELLEIAGRRGGWGA